MTAHSQHFPKTAAPVSLTALKPSLSWMQTTGMRFTAWAKICADYYSAAALYDQLSGLSDAELNRRGLSRATLARDVRLGYGGR